jgi:hypothetical protein
MIEAALSPFASRTDWVLNPWLCAIALIVSPAATTCEPAAGADDAGGAGSVGGAGAAGADAPGMAMLWPG